MNETLSKFSSKTLYGKGYKPATKEIAQQKLKLLPSKYGTLSETETDLVNWVLDPAYPLSLVILENTQATIENEIEAELVAKLAVHLRESLLREPLSKESQLSQKSLQNEKWEHYPESEEGDSDFWKNCLFIVSTHRAQIRTIQTHLSKLRIWYHSPFIDTVDKTQGQEAETVIVSYGVSDTDTAMNEAEFIYSLNRLNVSITRAKSKCIVFLPRPLLEPSLELLQNKEAAKGLNHMLNLVEFCKQNGEEKKFEIKSESYEKRIKLTGIKSKIFNK
ncbi:MAG TPA: C-terminal helicase domain-containing protein, partial [Methanosarcina sp.]|nr:C-terminal helicase domain-containing protein [Methanosarcina sp.]